MARKQGSQSGPPLPNLTNQFILNFIFIFQVVFESDFHFFIELSRCCSPALYIKNSLVCLTALGGSKAGRRRIGHVKNCWQLREALSDAELLAILIGSGTRPETADALASRILKSVDFNLTALSALSVAELMTFEGIGESKAIGIIAAMELYKRKNLQRPVYSFGLAKHTG